ncbi:MAG: pinensin family lanthipeptide [Bacteroidota bacterium]
MKKKKLSLNTLKVKSFVTDLEADQANTAKGGFSEPPYCFTFPPQCPTVAPQVSCARVCILP